MTCLVTGMRGAFMTYKGTSPGLLSGEKLRWVAWQEKNSGYLQESSVVDERSLGDLLESSVVDCSCSG